MLTLIGIFVRRDRNQPFAVTGARIAGELQMQMARGEAPVASLAAGVSGLVGAILMLIPGYLTDLCGLVLFLPVIRTLAGAIILKRIAARGSFYDAGRHAVWRAHPSVSNQAPEKPVAAPAGPAARGGPKLMMTR